MEPYQQLEARIRDWCQREQAVVCNSGTAALHLALESLNLPTKSEVVLPDFTMVACARAVILAGHIPVFVGCDENGLIDMAMLKRVVKRHTKVVMVVHVYGRAVNMTAVHEVARDAVVIEDLAEAHGVQPHPMTTAACWSFYKNKVIGGEEGGAIAYNSARFAHRARQLRSLGFTDTHDFWHIPRGHNYRLANCLASLIHDSFQLYDSNLRQRRHIEAMYNMFCPVGLKMPHRDVPWVYDVRVKDGMDAKVKALQAAGIAARHAFKPMHLLPEFSDFGYFGDSTSRELSETLLYLPLLNVTEHEIRKAFAILKETPQ